HRSVMSAIHSPLHGEVATMSFDRLSLHILILIALLAGGCASAPFESPRGLDSSELPIDLERFMGDWYVVAHMPTGAEKNAYEALEIYALRDDGKIDIRYHFCDGGLDGKAKELTMTGRVEDATTNAAWRVQPWWPLSLEYRVLELDADYQTTVIGHPSGKYAWIMARQPDLPDTEIDAITTRLSERGYETANMRRVPHADGACRATL
ncbi:MAG: lipocalin family protein, partial [Acidobacteriota bacterium]